LSALFEDKLKRLKLQLINAMDVGKNRIEEKTIRADCSD